MSQEIIDLASDDPVIITDNIWNINPIEENNPTVQIDGLEINVNQFIDNLIYDTTTVEIEGVKLDVNQFIDSIIETESTSASDNNQNFCEAFEKSDNNQDSRPLPRYLRKDNLNNYFIANWNIRKPNDIKLIVNYYYGVNTYQVIKVPPLIERVTYNANDIIELYCLSHKINFNRNLHCLFNWRYACALCENEYVSKDKPSKKKKFRLKKLISKKYKKAFTLHDYIAPCHKMNVKCTKCNVRLISIYPNDLLQHGHKLCKNFLKNA